MYLPFPLSICTLAGFSSMDSEVDGVLKIFLGGPDLMDPLFLVSVAHSASSAFFGASGDADLPSLLA